MSFYRGMTCENVTIKGDKGTPITAYVAKPSGPGPFPGVVLVHHLPGWSEFYLIRPVASRTTATSRSAPTSMSAGGGGDRRNLQGRRNRGFSGRWSTPAAGLRVSIRPDRREREKRECRSPR